MIFGRAQVWQVKIDDLLFFGTGSVTGHRRLRRDLRNSSSAALIRGGLALGLLVPRFRWLYLVRSSLALFVWMPAAGFGGLVFFCRRLLLDRFFFILGRLCVGQRKLGKRAAPARRHFLPWEREP